MHEALQRKTLILGCNKVYTLRSTVSFTPEVVWYSNYFLNYTEHKTAEPERFEILRVYRQLGAGRGACHGRRGSKFFGGTKTYFARKLSCNILDPYSIIKCY